MIFMIKINICVFDVEATVIFIIRMIIVWRLLKNLLYDYLLGLILKVSYYYYLVRVLVIGILLLFMCCIFIINCYIFSRFSVIIFIHLFWLLFLYLAFLKFFILPYYLYYLFLTSIISTVLLSFRYLSSSIQIFLLIYFLH